MEQNEQLAFRTRPFIIRMTIHFSIKGIVENHTQNKEFRIPEKVWIMAYDKLQQKYTKRSRNKNFLQKSLILQEKEIE